MTLAIQSVVQQELRERLVTVEEAFKADIVTVVSPIEYGLDDAFRDAVESLSHRRDSLLIILETEGGLIEVAERIAATARHHYPERVEFLIASHAMSAGTVLAMSGNTIHMDYYSLLGPIDPQVRNEQGRFVPALGYLEQYNRLIEADQAGTLTPVQAALLLNKFDLGELAAYEHARDLTVTLLENWLSTHKFADWDTHNSTGEPVTEDEKRHRAKEIATQLNDTSLWHSHGRGIGMTTLRERLRLKIEDFGSNELQTRAVRDYFRVVTEYRQAFVPNDRLVHCRTPREVNDTQGVA